MSKFQIVTESSCDLSPAMVEKMGVEIASLRYTIEGKTYRDTPDEAELPAKEFYRMVRSGSQSITSQVAQAEFMDIFRKYLAQGIDILYLGFSSGLSGTYNAGRLACEELREEFPERKLIDVDTLAASLGEGLLVYLACQQRDAGKSIEEVAQWALDNRGKIAHWFTVDDLNHLKRGGRVSATSAFVGTMLNIKPVLHVDDEGHLIPMEKVRGRKTSLDKLVEHMEQTAVDPKNATVFISHGDCLEDCRYVADKIREKFGTTDIQINTIGPVIGAHAGPGTVALFYPATSKN